MLNLTETGKLCVYKCMCIDIYMKVDFCKVAVVYFLACKGFCTVMQVLCEHKMSDRIRGKYFIFCVLS